MTRILPILFCALTWSLGGAAAAEPPGGADPDGLVTEYSFDDDRVPAELRRPLGEILQVRRRPAHGSLIHVRDHFIDRLLYAVEDL